MGMDVYGQFPTTKAGEYFRNNCWWWRPLAEYVCSVAPAVTATCKSWHYNDGDGLGPSDSVLLADALQAEIDTRRCAKYAARYQREIAAIPSERCDLCGGSGVRSDTVGVSNRFHLQKIDKVGHPRFGQTGWCNACDGTGETEPSAKYYPFSVENVQEFVTFLRGCGGFEIW